jgi:UDP-arabinose 4-epimerase
MSKTGEFMNQTILVTGGAGYIGSHTCKELSKEGFTPITLDSLEHGHPQGVLWGPLVEGNIGDKSLLEQLFTDYQPIAVIHCAAYAYVGESVFDPLKYYDNNIASTVTLLKVMEQFGCRTLIFTSSCATYGVPVQTPIPEEHQQHPINPYGWSKLIVEQMLKDLSATKAWQYGVLRFFNAAGADAEGELGENHQPETHLIPLIFQTILGNQPYLEIFGDDYPTPDGTAIRDYIHVTDLATAHVTTLKKLLNSSGNICANLGTGEGYSVREIIAMAEKITKKTVPIRHKARRAGDPPELIAKLGSIQTLLPNWPNHSQLENIMQTAWRWHSHFQKRRV